MVTSVLRQDTPAVAGAVAGSPSPNLRRLLERMRRLGFGTVRGLHVRSGDPLFDPPYLVVSIHRTTEPAPKRTPSPASGFALSREQSRFAEILAQVGDGVIDLIKVHDGLPTVVEIHEQP